MEPAENIKNFKKEFVVADDTGLLKRIVLEGRTGKESVIEKLEQKEKAAKGLKGKQQKEVVEEQKQEEPRYFRKRGRKQYEGPGTMDNGVEEAVFIENDKTTFSLKQKQKAGKQEAGLNIVSICKISDEHLVLARKNKTLELISIESLETIHKTEELEDKIVSIKCVEQQQGVIALKMGKLIKFKVEENEIKLMESKKTGSSEITSIAVNQKVVAVCSKDTLLFTVDWDTLEVKWASKNVPNDELDLQVPIYDTDVCFVESQNSKRQKKSLLVTCTALGELRLYDPQANLRPVARADVNKGKVLHRVSGWTGDSVVAANQAGELLVCSLKLNFQLLRKLQGSQTGSQTSLLRFQGEEGFGHFLLATGLDRYLRLFSHQEGSKENARLYLGNKLIQALQL